MRPNACAALSLADGSDSPGAEGNRNAPGNRQHNAEVVAHASQGTYSRNTELSEVRSCITCKCFSAWLHTTPMPNLLPVPVLWLNSPQSIVGSKSVHRFKQEAPVSHHLPEPLECSSDATCRMDQHTIRTSLHLMEHGTQNPCTASVSPYCAHAQQSQLCM